MAVGAGVANGAGAAGVGVPAGCGSWSVHAVSNITAMRATEMSLITVRLLGSIVGSLLGAS
ncbi:MAG: hypothetical protein HYY31_01765 [Chloroflexi bacterium]|nr:hypothetical protein [Chloroflexota bacterium]